MIAIEFTEEEIEILFDHLYNIQALAENLKNKSQLEITKQMYALTLSRISNLLRKLETAVESKS